VIHESTSRDSAAVDGERRLATGKRPGWATGCLHHRARRPQPQRGDIFVALPWSRELSSVGAAYSAPTGLAILATGFYKDAAATPLPFLQHDPQSLLGKRPKR
jgi:hypothetical protein